MTTKVTYAARCDWPDCDQKGPEFESQDASRIWAQSRDWWADRPRVVDTGRFGRQDFCADHKDMAQFAKHHLSTPITVSSAKSLSNARERAIA